MRKGTGKISHPFRLHFDLFSAVLKKSKYGGMVEVGASGFIRKFNGLIFHFS